MFRSLTCFEVLREVHFLSHPGHLFVVSALKCLLISVLPELGGGGGGREVI